MIQLKRIQVSVVYLCSSIFRFCPNQVLLTILTIYWLNLSFSLTAVVGSELDLIQRHHIHQVASLQAEISNLRREVEKSRERKTRPPAPVGFLCILSLCIICKIKGLELFYEVSKVSQNCLSYYFIIYILTYYINTI